jgi:hypothetical protein
MRKLFLPGFILCILLFATNACSQGLRNEIKVYHPDFSGTWKLDPLKSRLKNTTVKEDSDYGLVVAVDQKLPVISVRVMFTHLAESETVVEFNLYTDGRASDFPGLSNPRDETVEWKDNNLVLTNFSSGKGRKTILSVLEIALSADGKALICTQKSTKKGIGTDGESITIVDDTETEYVVFDRVPDIPARSNRTPLPEEE